MKIKDLENGLKVTIPLLISNVTKGVTQNGAPYLSITFKDSSGEIEGKWWDISPQDEALVAQGKIGEVTCDVLLYRTQLQIRVHKIDFSQEYNLSDFVVASEYTPEYLKVEILKFIELIENPTYKSIVKASFDHFGKDFFDYPAATRNHHDFVGGLATHVYTMCKLAMSMKDIYPLIDLDLLLSGILVHDMGKIQEYSAPVLSEYTDEGKLLGHISIMQAQIFEIAKSLNLEKTEEAMLLRHLILAHHGEYEFGSPVRPQVVEAEVLNFIDNIDARMEMFSKLFNNQEPGTFSTRVFALENRSFYKPKGVK